MKIRAYKKFLAKALLTYTYEVQEKFDGRLYTEHTKENMKNFLLDFQNHKQHTDPNPIWEVPVDLQFNPNNNTFVVVADESNVLWLDFEDYI